MSKGCSVTDAVVVPRCQLLLSSLLATSLTEFKILFVNQVVQNRNILNPRFDCIWAEDFSSLLGNTNFL